MTAPARICLVMIVRDEARVIERCLAAARPLIDAWCVVDTGSSDATPDLVRAALADVPGTLHERPWVDFGHNRTEALALARPLADYLFVLDADDVLVAQPGFAWPALDRDAYYVPISVGDSPVRYDRLQLVRSAAPWRYEGVIHEHLACDVPHTLGHVAGLAVKSLSDGARNADPRAKYERDAAVLEAALAKEPGHTRYAFYLAQSYRDAGLVDRAIEAYERRAELGGFDEEIYVARLEAARLRAGRGDAFDPLVGAYLRAYQARPQRAEALVDLARALRLRGDHALAHLFASRAASIPRPPDILFVDESVHAWRARDELAVASYWIGDLATSLALSTALLADPALPDEERPRIATNRDLAARALAERRAARKG